MTKIPTIPKQSKTVQRLRNLPVPIQLVLIVLLLYLTWHFRYYTTGIDEAELTKIDGVLYSFECRSRLRGSDEIILYTSLPEGRIQFSSWQKCKNIPNAAVYSEARLEVVFYTKQVRGFIQRLNNTDAYSLVYAVDLKSPRKKLIYPANGLGTKRAPNFLAMLFSFIALAIGDGLRERWMDKRKTQKKNKFGKPLE